MSERPLRFLLPVLTALFSLWVAGVFFRIAPEAFVLGYTPYVIPSLIALAANVVVLYRLATLRNKNEAIAAFALVSLSLAIWAASQSLQIVSLTPEGFIFWDSIQAAGWVSLPVSFLFFTLAYLRSQVPARYPSLVVFLVISTLCFLYLGMATGQIDSHDPADYVKVPWGFATAVHPMLFSFLAWLASCFLVSFALLIGVLAKTKAETARRQIKLIVIATSIPFVGGIITDGVLPALGYELMPMAVILTSFMDVLIAYAMIRFSLLSFNPAVVSTTILDTMQEAVLVLNARYEIDYGNLKTVRLLGLTPDQLPATSLGAVFGRSWGDVKRRLLLPLRRREFTQIELSHIRTAGGRKVPVSLSAARVTDEEGTAEGYVLVIADVTDLERSYASLQEKVRQIRQQNRKLASLGEQLKAEKEGVEYKVEVRTRQVKEGHAQLLASINSLNFGFLMTGPHLEVLLTNTAASEVLFPGLDRAADHEDLVRLSQRLGERYRLLECLEDCIKDKRTIDLPDVMLGTRILHVFLSPITLEAEVIGAVVLIQDVTEARTLERARDEFFTIASHELRTPLTAIRGYSELIRDTYATQLKDPKFERMVDNIEEGAKRLMKIVNDFLSASLLEQGRIAFELAPLNLVSLVREVTSELEAMITSRGLYLKVQAADPSLSVVADHDKLKQVVTNLIGNAAKFTSEGGITIFVEQQDGKAAVRVKDTGIGIPAKNQHLLFRKFQQAGRSLLTRDASHGTGIGLYVAKLMVEGMGGGIALESSRAGHGSTFVFTLPLIPTSEV